MSKSLLDQIFLKLSLKYYFKISKKCHLESLLLISGKYIGVNFVLFEDIVSEQQTYVFGNIKTVTWHFLSPWYLCFQTEANEEDRNIQSSPHQQQYNQQHHDLNTRWIQHLLQWRWIFVSINSILSPPFRPEQMFPLHLTKYAERYVSILFEM